MPRLPDLGPRYQPLRPLGAGGEGSVWLVQDALVPGRELAVKLLGSETELPALQREFALLSRLRHPGLAMVHELGRGRDGAFLVRDFVDGRPLLEAEHPTDALGQLLGILDFLHRRGVVHRDLKAENVLVGAGGVTLLDFGLAIAEGRRAELGGTAGAIAPELLRGEAPSARSDLYAVGVLLCQVLWGRRPFEGSAAEIMAAQLDRDPELPDGPAPLRELAMQLLRRDPARRPGSAAEVLGSLEEGGTPGAQARFLAGRGVPEPALCGREAELEIVRAALAAASEGRSCRGLLLVGQRGAGRSRLTDEIACLAQLGGIHLQRGLSPGPIAEPHPVETAEGALAVRRIVDGVRSLPRPAVLLVDDLDDALQVRVVLALARLDEPGLLLVAACQPGEPEKTLAAELRRVELRDLDEKSTTELVASMVPTGLAPATFAADIHRLSGGNPALSVELARRGVARLIAGETFTPEQLKVESLLSARLSRLGAAARTLGGLCALFERGAPAAVLVELLGAEPGQALGELLREGVVVESGGQLRVPARSLACALVDALPAATREQLGRRALARLDALGAPAGQRAMLALAAGLGGEEQALLVEGARQARSSLELVTSLELYQAAIEAAGDRALRGELLSEAAALELSLGRTAAAVRHLGRALEEAGAERPARLFALADAHLRGGQPLEALSLVDRERAAESAARRRSLDGLRAKLLLFAGRVEEAGREASALLPAGDAAEAAELLHTLGLSQYYQGELEQAVGSLAQALHEARRGESRLAEARVLNSLAMVHQRRGELDRARALYEECLELARRLRHLPFEATFLQNLASLAQQRGAYALALQRYQQSLEVARGFGGERETAQVLHNLGRLQGLLGQDARALLLLRRSAGLARSTAWPSLLAQNLLAEGEVHLLAGRLEEGRGCLSKAEALFKELGELAPAAETTVAIGRLHLLRGEPGPARARAEEALASAGGMEAVRLQAELLLGSALVEQGEARSGIERLRAALRIAESAEGAALVEVHHRLARALAGAGDAAAAAEHARAAREALERQAAELPLELRAGFLRAGSNARVMEEETAPAAPGRKAALDAELLAALLGINKELNAEPDLQRLLERIIDHAVELAGAERGFLLMKRGDELDIQVARNIDQETIRRKEFKISRSVAEEVLSSGRPLLTVDALEDERFRDFLSVHNLRLRSVLCVPMSVRRQVRGAIYLDNRFQTRAFGAQEAALLGALAEQAGLALANRELLEENRRRQEELERSREELRRVNAELEQAIREQSQRMDELTQLARTQQGELSGRYRFEELIGQSAAMRDLFRLMDRVRGSDAPVLIQGESGTGKELVAKALHYAGARREAPFVSVNCGALSPTLLESELFGYERGAFTGAERQHRGLFERADQGSLFLDEVGDMPPELQVKLLRVLQEKRFERLGGEHEISSDFRLIAASNKDLGELVQKGEFRQDLYFRINVIKLPLPPLRDRREDIPLLTEHLLRRHGGEREVQLSPAAARLLLEHDWPGNVRELENELMRALALSGPVIGPEDLALGARRARPAELDTQGLTLAEAVARLERQLVSQTLRECRGSVTEAARRLGMTRVGLHKLMKRHGLDRHGSVA